MGSRLQIKTNNLYKEEEDAGDEPVSPTGQYFNSNTMSVRVLGVLESEIPIDDSLAMPLLRDLFLPINPRFSSIMLPKDRPLWECHIVKYPTSKAAGNVIFKLHHALGDGFSLMGALLSCMQRADNPSLSLTFPSLQPSTEDKSKSKKGVGCLPKTIMSAIYNTTRDFGWSILKSSIMADQKTPIRSGEEGVEFHPVQISTAELSLFPT